ncbi:phage protein NinX family protein [Azohydromonas lata]|uniref:phage protein NinX family protein n=1 Tax=Azohydromonas lata TaxID=45677 RepID=UPI000832F628|nr:phage protein NinX family protein [Azohydromonas lata]
MPTYRVDELEGARLDAAVAKAEGMEFRIEVMGEAGQVCFAPWHHTFGMLGMQPYSPSVTWGLAGPIIEREGIALERINGQWFANIGEWINGDHLAVHHSHASPTLLVAAMRALVVAKLGAEVDL